MVEMTYVRRTTVGFSIECGLCEWFLTASCADGKA